MKIAAIIYLLILFLLLAGSEAIASTKLGKAKARIFIFEEKLALFKKDIGRYPTTNEGLKVLLVSPADMPNWKGPYVPYTVIPTDPWFQPYIYNCPAVYGFKEFDLYSTGKNCSDEKGKGDDISNWNSYNAWEYNPKGIIVRYCFWSLIIFSIVFGFKYLYKKRILTKKSQA